MHTCIGASVRSVSVKYIIYNPLVRSPIACKRIPAQGGNRVATRWQADLDAARQADLDAAGLNRILFPHRERVIGFFVVRDRSNPGYR